MVSITRDVVEKEDIIFQLLRTDVEPNDTHNLCYYMDFQ